MSRVYRVAAVIAGLLAAAAISPAGAQNLEAGKSPAQLFSDTCSACHRRAQDLKKPSASFLRSHYTTGQDEASALAAYLAGIPSDPRGSQQKKQSGATPAEPRSTTRRPEQPKEQPKEQSREQAKSTQGPAEGAKGRRPRNTEERGAAPAAAPVATAAPAPAVQATPAEPQPQAQPQPQPAAAPAPPAKPPLEPFEE